MVYKIGSTHVPTLPNSPPTRQIWWRNCLITQSDNRKKRKPDNINKGGLEAVKGTKGRHDQVQPRILLWYVFFGCFFH